MANDELNVVVLLRQCRDPRPPVSIKNGGHAINARDVRTMLNQVTLAHWKKRCSSIEKYGGRLTVLAIGSKSVESHLRTGLSMGAERAVRITDRSLGGYDDAGLSRVLSRAFDILSPSLICTGNVLEDRGFDPVFPLAAARSGIPCVQNVITALVQDDGVQTLKTTDHGAGQLVETPLPAA